MVNYGYDQASELTGLTYSLGGNELGNLTYAYDADGRRIQMGGSWARTGTPNPTTSTAVYNVDNQLTNWNGASLAGACPERSRRDANGNMTGDARFASRMELRDGTNTYTWDARNQLTSISGITTDSFEYGPFGRRQSKTINGTTTDFLYDGVNPVQELSGGTVNANMLDGLGVDEYFQRTDSTNTSDFLTDALGSTLALADASGTVQTQYTYDPYGATTTQGSSSENSFQFTGRENDGDGLYYSRARYYSPTLDRFISEDPVGFDGGIDLYAYAEGSPAQMKDPFGLFPPGWTGLCKNSRCAKLFQRVFHLTPQQFNADAGSIPWFYSPSSDTFGPLNWNFLSGNGDQGTISGTFNGSTEAATATGGSPSNPSPVVLGPSWFFDSPAHAAAVLLHEATHSITGWSDKQIFDALSKYGLPDREYNWSRGTNTDEFTEWLMKGCPK